jgi:DNA mismatch repair ATPase MutS
MRLLESHRFEDPHLSELQQALEPTRGVTASAAMKRLDSLAGLAALRHNALIYIVAELLLSWDVWCAFLLDRWRARYGARVDGWLEALSELEALAALATFADEHPGYAWPELAGDSPHFRAVALGHPLIVPPQRVVNDVTLDAEVAALMITGSNMSGKSTMLRSVGIAAVLAQAGGPVCAQQLALSPLRVITSMRVGDALDRGASRFYMEVRKLKRVVDELDGEVPLLFLLDEVLHGTNSRERNIGAKAVVKHLVAHGAIGAVSSHDLGLVELESLTDGRVMNVHFEDHLEAGEMRFDYRMKAGPVSTSNALRLMREVGIRVEGLAD